MDQVFDLRTTRSQRAGGNVDMERPAVSEPDPTVGAILETTDRDPGGAVERQHLVDGTLVGPPGLAVDRPDRAGDLAVDHDLDPSQRHRADGRTPQAVLAGPRVGRHEAVTGVGPVKPDQAPTPG